MKCSCPFSWFSGIIVGKHIPIVFETAKQQQSPCNNKEHTIRANTRTLHFFTLSVIGCTCCWHVRMHKNARDNIPSTLFAFGHPLLVYSGRNEVGASSSSDDFYDVCSVGFPRPAVRQSMKEKISKIWGPHGEWAAWAACSPRGTSSAKLFSAYTTCTSAYTTCT